jgi:hypothetical protein
MPADSVGMFYRHALQERGWEWRAGNIRGSTYRRGEAMLYVVVDANSILMNTDYQGYAGAGR